LELDASIWELYSSLWKIFVLELDNFNEPPGAKGPPLVGEEVRKKDVGKVGS
jgi:hypothetical protein